MKTLLVGALAVSLLVAAVVTVVSLLQPPRYEASTKVLVDQEQGNGQDTNLGGSGEEIKAEGYGQPAQTMVLAIETRPIAEEVIRRLGLELSPEELLDNLTVDVEPVEHTHFVRLVYLDTDPLRAMQVVNTVGQVSSERISASSATANNITATVFDKASVPDTPASPKPLRNGLIALVVALALSAALIEARSRRVFGG